jgi:hypothetical protein
LVTLLFQESTDPNEDCEFAGVSSEIEFWRRQIARLRRIKECRQPSSFAVLSDRGFEGVLSFSSSDGI